METKQRSLGKEEEERTKKCVLCGYLPMSHESLTHIFKIKL